MGRLSASGARLHEPRQPKPANAAFRQGRPLRSHGSSLGPEHPQRAIPPACREGPTLGVIRRPRAPSAAGAGTASANPDPPRRPWGALPASSPWNPTGRMPAQSAAGLLPGTRRVPGISAGKPSKEALHRGRSGEPRQRPRSVARPNGGFAEGAGLARRQIAASMPHAGGPTDRRPRPRLSKRPRKRPWDGQLRRRKCTKRNAAPKAPQERRPAI